MSDAQEDDKNIVFLFQCSDCIFCSLHESSILSPIGVTWLSIRSNDHNSLCTRPNVVVCEHDLPNVVNSPTGVRCPSGCIRLFNRSFEESIVLCRGLSHVQHKIYDFEFICVVWCVELSSKNNKSLSRFSGRRDSGVCEIGNEVPQDFVVGGFVLVNSGVVHAGRSVKNPHNIECLLAQWRGGWGRYRAG